MATRKVLVSLDDRLVERLDATARERGLSRSALLAQLAENELGPTARAPNEQRRVDVAMRRLRELGRRYGTGDEDSAVLVRRMRDERTRRLAR